MFASVRCYAVASPRTVHSLADHADEIRAVLSSVPGTQGGHVIRARDGVIVVALGDDERSVMESSRRFVAWSVRHVVAFRDVPAPEVWAGEILIDLPTSNADGPHAPVGGRP